MSRIKIKNTSRVRGGMGVQAVGICEALTVENINVKLHGRIGAAELT
jgi:hypothetical protein